MLRLKLNQPLLKKILTHKVYSFATSIIVFAVLFADGSCTKVRLSVTGALARVPFDTQSEEARQALEDAAVRGLGIYSNPANAKTGKELAQNLKPFTTPESLVSLEPAELLAARDLQALIMIMGKGGYALLTRVVKALETNYPDMKIATMNALVLVEDLEAIGLFKEDKDSVVSFSITETFVGGMTADSELLDATKEVP